MAIDWPLLVMLGTLVANVITLTALVMTVRSQGRTRRLLQQIIEERLVQLSRESRE